jgi:glycosyltransferase involved in cell wall biosynthesis
MKVLYDYQIFIDQEYGGVSRYFYELIHRWNSFPPIEFALPLKYSNNAYISKWPITEHSPFLPGISFRGKRRVLTLLNKRSSIVSLKLGQFDIFHPTYYDPYFLEYCSKPFVLTVYDMIHEKFNKHFSTRDKTSANKKLLCHKAARIIAISQNTKNDIVKLFNIPADKIEVVTLGNSLSPQLVSNIILPHKYVLFVGVREKYKNFRFLASAMSPLLMNDKELHLVCAGGGGFSRKELQYFKELGISRQVMHIPITDSTLVQLYKNAMCFIYPSLYEGFGIPILEAFACACPTLLSRASCFPEIAGDAALYFDPCNNEELVLRLQSVLDNSELRRNLSKKGTERLKLYSWDKCAIETLGIYKRIT